MTVKALKRPMEELREQIEEAGGVDVVPMWKLRDAAGYDRLGVNVVRDIASKMRRSGLATLPPMERLPLSRSALIRVYVTDGRLGDIIAAVLEPSDRGDKLLRDVGGDDASEVLEGVRQLVCGS